MEVSDPCYKYQYTITTVYCMEQIQLINFLQITSYNNWKCYNVNTVVKIQEVDNFSNKDGDLRFMIIEL